MRGFYSLFDSTISVFIGRINAEAAFIGRMKNGIVLTKTSWLKIANLSSVFYVAENKLRLLMKLLRIEDFALRKMSLPVNNRLENDWLLIEINSDTCRVKAIPFNGGHVGGLLACIRIEIIYKIMDQCFCVRSKLTRGFWSMTVLLLICVHTWIYEMSIVWTSMTAVYAIGFTMG